MTPLLLIMLHTVDGLEVDINPKQITSLRETRPDKEKHLVVAGVHCAVGLSDGKFVTVVESCADIRKKIEEQK
jgi:hypothetical protein